MRQKDKNEDRYSTDQQCITSYGIMLRSDYSDYSRDGPFAAMDTFGCGKYGGSRGGETGRYREESNIGHLK